MTCNRTSLSTGKKVKNEYGAKNWTHVEDDEDTEESRHVEGQHQL